jgi:hypothetical protein
MIDVKTTRDADPDASLDEAAPDPARARALRLLVEELRAEAVPAMPWEGSEARLLAALGPAPVVRATAAPSVLGRAFAFVAAAACIALGLSSQGGAPHGLSPVATHAASPVDVARIAAAPGEAGARGDRDLEALRVGDVVESGAEPVTFARAGLVRWTLAPGSRVVVRSGALGDSGATPAHVVALERGSLRAEVVPRDPAEGLTEPFAVEVEGTRVAVHGTAFTVTRSVEDLVVDVEHGTVAVGPTGHTGLTVGRILVGPSRATFSRDGGRSARFLDRADADPGRVAVVASPPEPVAAAPMAANDPLPTVASPPAGTRARSGPGSAPAAHEAEVPSAEHTAPAPLPDDAPDAPGAPAAPAAPAGSLSVSSVRGGLGRCFEQTYIVGSSPAVRLSVASSFILEVRADGSIKSARFDPPLKPEFQTCAAGVIAGRFEARSPGGPLVTVRIPVAFEH